LVIGKGKEMKGEREREGGKKEGRREGRKEGKSEKQNHLELFIWITVIYSFTQHFYLFCFA